jgi:nucleoside-diphosphate-sugar epimerase
MDAEAEMETKEKILCTGAAGFIGRHLTEELKRRGAEVFGLLGPADRRPEDAGPGITWLQADITDRASLRDLPWPFTRIYHLAGVLSSMRAEAFYRVNYEGTRNLAEEALAHEPPRRFLLASSLAAAGPAADRRGCREDGAGRPVSDYGRSKLMAELFLQSLAGRMPVTIVRLPLVYGPGSEGGLFSYFQQIRKGFYLDLGDRLSTVAYVEDVVRGMRLAAECSSAAAEIYHLGESEPHPSDEILSFIRSSLGIRPVRIRMPYRLGYCGVALYEAWCRLRGRQAYIQKQDMTGYIKFPYWIADTTKARRELGFTTEVSLGEGLRRTADWYRNRGIL